MSASAAHRLHNFQQVQEALPYGRASAPPARARRTTRACDTCRLKKSRCDGRQPVCMTCIEEGRRCSYTPFASPAENTNSVINEKLQMLEKNIEAVLAKQSAQNIQIDQLTLPLRMLCQQPTPGNVSARQGLYHEVYNQPKISQIKPKDDLSSPVEHYLHSSQPSAAVEQILKTLSSRAPVCNESGLLPLENKDFDILLDSYIEFIHVQHPFLDIPVLRQMVASFKKSKEAERCWLQKNSSACTGRKRRRCGQSDPAVTLDETTVLMVQINSDVQVEASMKPILAEKAILHLVFAIGCLCKYRTEMQKPLPLWPTHWSRREEGSFTSGLEFTKLRETMTKRTQPEDRTDDVPGLQFFLVAKAALKSLPNTLTLSEIQANLLASLYLGLLARVHESQYYLSKASKACRALLTSSTGRAHMNGGSAISLLQLAAWNCSHLERDFSAETNLISSILADEDFGEVSQTEGLCLQRSTITSVGEDVLKSFLCEMQLRRIFNDACSELYSDESMERSKPSLGLVSALNFNLGSWRKTVYSDLYELDDHRKFNNAILIKASYYMVKHVINRPVLEYCLQNTPPCSSRASASPVSWTTQDSEMDTRLSDDTMLFIFSKECIHATIEHMKICSNAIILRTPNLLTRLHRYVPKYLKMKERVDKVRLIRDLLLLSAVFASGDARLSEIVDEDTLRKLYTRVISLLRECQPMWFALSENIRILQAVGCAIWPEE